MKADAVCCAEPFVCEKCTKGRCQDCTGFPCTCPRSPFAKFEGERCVVHRTNHDFIHRKVPVYIFPMGREGEPFAWAGHFFLGTETFEVILPHPEDVARKLTEYIDRIAFIFRHELEERVLELEGERIKFMEQIHELERLHAEACEHVRRLHAQLQRFREGDQIEGDYVDEFFETSRELRAMRAFVQEIAGRRCISGCGHCPYCKARSLLFITESAPPAPPRRLVDSTIHGAIEFARKTWQRDGAEGDTVHALCDELERRLLGPPIVREPNTEAGDFNEVCSCCGREDGLPHTWEQCARILQESEWQGVDAAIEQKRLFNQHVEALRGLVDANDKWFNGVSTVGGSALENLQGRLTLARERARSLLERTDASST